MVRGLQGWSFGSRRLSHVAVLVVVSQLFISVTDLGGCGLDLSPRMRSRRKRAQRAVLLLLITTPQTALHHSHQVACGSLAPRAQLLLQLSILVSERRLPARITAQQCYFLLSQIPEMDWLPSERFSRSQEQSGAFSYPIPGFGATPCRIWLPSLGLVLILCSDIIYPHSHREMPKFLVANVHQRIPNDLGWVLQIKDSYFFLSVRLKRVGDVTLVCSK